MPIIPDLWTPVHESGLPQSSSHLGRSTSTSFIYIEIWTERLLLRAAEQSDLDAFRKFFADPEAMKYWSTAAHSTVEKTQEFLDATISGPYNGVLDFVVCLPDPPGATTANGNNGNDTDDDDSVPATVIGRAGIWDGKEIGFIFNREYWGKGYAFEAVDALLKQFWAINTSENAIVTADVDPRNKGSLHLLTKLGFVVVGAAKNTYETHIGWCDSVYLEARRPTSA